jgi:hypothetical protein
MAEINQGILDDIVNSISDTKKSGESFRQEAKANHTNLSLVVKDLNSLVLKNKSSIEQSVNQIDGKVREIEEDIAGQIQNIYSEIQKNTAIQQNIINTIYQLDKKIESLMTKGVGGELVKPGSLTERLKTAFGSGATTPLSPVTTGITAQTAGQALGAAGAISTAAIKSGAEYFGITQPEQVRTPAGEQPLPKDTPSSAQKPGSEKAQPPGGAINPDRVIADVTQGKISPEDAVVKTALSMKGLHEQRDQQILMEFLRNGGKSFVNPATTAWCSSFVNASLATVGIKGTGSAAAGSWHKWGNAVSDKENFNPEAVQKGDVIVNYNISKATGMVGDHVEIVAGEPYQDRNGKWVVKTVGGNTSNSVKEMIRPLDQWAVRRAPETEQYYDPRVLAAKQQSTATATKQSTDQVEKPKPQSQVFLSPKEEKVLSQKLETKGKEIYGPFNIPTVQQISRDAEKHFPDEWSRARPEFKAEVERIAREQYQLRDEENAARAAAAAKQQPVAQPQAAPQPKPETQPVQQEPAPQPKPVSEQSIIDRVMSAIGPSSAKAEELPPPKPEEPKPSGTEPPPAKQLEQAAVKKEAAQPVLSQDEKQSIDNIRSDRDNNPIPAPPGKNQTEKIDLTYFSKNDNWYGGWRERSPYPKNYRVDI